MALCRAIVRLGCSHFSPEIGRLRISVLHQWKRQYKFFSGSKWNPHQQTVIQRNNTHKLISRLSFSTDRSGSKKVVQFNLTDIGEGIRDVNVKEWFVKVGDRVAQFDSICEVQSDKASVTITSRYDGIVTKIYHDVDDVALVGQPLVDIELEGELNSEVVQSGEDVAQSNENVAQSSEDAEDTSDDDSSSSSDEEDDKRLHKVLTTPAVRHMAKANEINLQDVKGTGYKGRITKEDVQMFIHTMESATKVQPEVTQQTPPIEPRLAFQPLPTTTSVDRTETITGIRKAMVKSMTSANLIPHFSYSDEVNMSRMVDMKPIFKDVAQKYGIKFSYTSLFVKAASAALKKFPILNSSVDSECNTITYKASHNIGVAMDSPCGLMVPNVKNVAQLSILEIASELNRLMQLSASGKLGPADLTGGTFTLSNIGMIGGTYLKPVIFSPEVVIGALGSITKLPRFDENDRVVAAHIMNVSWSADHRVIDGATMARFSNLWKSYLENPAGLLLDMK